MGRPFSTFTPERVKEIKKQLEKYIDETDIPILKKFSSEVLKVPSKRLYEISDLEETIKVCVEKKEANLEHFALYEKIKASMAIFSLKQLGWKDNQHLTIKDERELSDEELDREIQEALKELGNDKKEKPGRKKKTIKTNKGKAAPEKNKKLKR